MTDTDHSLTEESGGVANFEWSEDSVTVLNNFDNGTSLPCVARLESIAGAGASSLPPGLSIYAGQPVLLHERTCKKHAKARTIYHDKDGPYFEVGQTLDIPDDFQGWFEVVPPDFGRGNVFRSIEQVAQSSGRKFFTRTNIRAIRVHAEEEAADEETQSFKERKIPAGTVLTVKGTFAAKWQTTAQTGFIKRKSKEYTTVEIPYLKCLDTDDTEVLVPLSTRGRFSLVYEKGVRDSRTVYRIKDILEDLQLPLKVRMVYGKPPMVPCIFSGMLALKGKAKEDTIIASTILNKRNVLFELPVDANCAVTTAVNMEQFENMRTYIDAQLLCKKYAHSFGTLIKLSPEMDTNQSMIQHIPTEKRKSRDESLKTLDLITNISVTDDEPNDFMFESSDNDSVQSAELPPLGMGQMMDIREITLPKTSQMISDA
ncbi:uncharacterized protein LOC127861885 [Dreissena polymorpha]|uniref:CABIT domain-containing protein n=1 Tax=Dreissena polymorpha TaxID=45954 RepID=A0A9D3Y6C6_DREPO|nr:uncharacterized protein LOC127861885 [Dreissena polymorpha]KAH3694668.1 hypothetical protein DPMN_082109 [Dreissena polymorpha]